MALQTEGQGCPSSFLPHKTELFLELFGLLLPITGGWARWLHGSRPRRPCSGLTAPSLSHQRDTSISQDWSKGQCASRKVAVRTILEIEGESEFILIHNNTFEFSSYVRGSVL